MKFTGTHIVETNELTVEKENSHAEQESLENSDWDFLPKEIDMTLINGKAYMDVTHFQSMLRQAIDSKHSTT